MLLFFCSVLPKYPWMQLSKKEWNCRSWFSKASYYFGEVVVDIFDLGKNLLTVDSARIIAGFTPVYIATRWVDEDVQKSFYDGACHKNINQLPKVCHQAAQKGVAAPMVFLSSLTFFGWTEDIRLTGRMTAITLPFVQSGKDIIKKAEFKACLRPWHEEFSDKKRSTGGFPSGHMANVTFMTALWWKRHGPKWGIPLSLFSVLVFVDFANCNRHYVSQLVAGAGLGLLFAFAADKVVTKKLNDRLSIGPCSYNGNPGFGVSYNF